MFFSTEWVWMIGERLRGCSSVLTRRGRWPGRAVTDLSLSSSPPSSVCGERENERERERGAGTTLVRVSFQGEKRGRGVVGDGGVEILVKGLYYFTEKSK